MRKEGFVGIRNSMPKTLLIKRGRYRIVEKETDALAYDCGRITDLLERYRDGRDLLGSLYFKLSGTHFKKDGPYIKKRMKRFIDLYEKTKTGQIKEVPIIVTVNNARLDGSHRIGILKSLGIKKVKVREVFGPGYLLWIIGREVSKRKRVYEKYKGKKAYVNNGFKGNVLFTDFIKRDPLSLHGDYYHVLDTGSVVGAKECCLKG